MPMPINTMTGNIPLKLAKKITNIVNENWDSGEYLELVTPTTKELLKFWFDESYSVYRDLNFHKGQKQAILNVIYLHEILDVKNVIDMYEKVDEDLLLELDLEVLSKQKYDFAKYAFKMATGTGKTWVMNALFLWQYLNAKNETTKSGKFSKNFLLVAPGIIVYDRLLDSYLGKERVDGSRDINTSDILKNSKLFLPQNYRQTIKAFLSSSVVKKDEIGKKITSDGMVAITNWHLLMGKEEVDEYINPINDPSQMLKELLPAKPGRASGNELESLDRAYFSGSEIEYLASLDDLVVINDEAHHIHENKKDGVVQEVEWQKSLNYIQQNKKFFSQIDFSATPYDTTGSGQKRAKHYFPHIVVDFDLKDAISGGLVKMITIDKRKELASLPLEFKAIRDGEGNKGKVIALSDGQKTMIQAGLKKLEILEDEFVKFDSTKHPKMLIMCEDTEVVPFVEEYLKSLDLTDDEIMSVHSNKKGELKENEWNELKQKLFNVDSLENPKVIVSVLMLREGFDVSNICVIVPLRSSEASILLEQTIGRGLRLMFRKKVYEEIKKENLHNVLVKKQPPSNYLDVLTIIEHPAFNEFYDDLVKEGFVAEDKELKKGISLGDMINVGLKKDYKKYDLYFPNIVADEVEELIEPEFDISKLSAYELHSLKKLKSWSGKGEVFHSQELTVKTYFGEYKIDVNLFKAQNYNEFLVKILEQITHTLGKTKQKGHSKKLPLMQINNAKLLQTIDTYIRTKLFNEPFNPFVDESWRVLMIKGVNITEHIIKEISRLVYDMQNEVVLHSAKIEKIYFSIIDELKMRETYSLDLVKTIYEKTPYPSNKGGFEKAFLEFLDSDTKVLRFIKIDEYKHDFARVSYFRDDGLMGWYSPDFMVESIDKIYLIETKSDKDLKDINVKQKQRATVDFINRVNKVDTKKWEYLLVGETMFYSLVKSGANIKDIANSANINEKFIKSSLF